MATYRIAKPGLGSTCLTLLKHVTEMCNVFVVELGRGNEKFCLF